MWLIVHGLDFKRFTYVYFMCQFNVENVHICTSRAIIRKGCVGDHIFLISLDVCVMSLYKRTDSSGGHVELKCDFKSISTPASLLLMYFKLSNLRL